MASDLENELTDLGQKMKVRADVLGFEIEWRIVAGTGWQAFKLEITGPSRRADIDERFADEKTTALFTARQARMALRAHKPSAFMGWSVK